MKTVAHSIIGAGLSALVRDHLNNNSVVYCNYDNKLLRSKKFYENLGIGGNTNIWGGYINYHKYLFFLKNNKFKKFMQNQKIFKLRKLFTESPFKKTYYISNYLNKKVLRIKKRYFKNLVINKKIEKISLDKKNIFLHTGKQKILTKKVSLCVGNLSLIQILYNSKIIGANDKISFDDGICSYQFNLFKNFNTNYYIPLTIKEIVEKFLYGKKNQYHHEIKKTLFVQKFSKSYKKYSFTTSEIMKFKSNNIRYFLTHHTTNLRINDIKINKFIKNFSKKITIYNSGAIQNYIAGPVSQDIIFNALSN